MTDKIREDSIDLIRALAIIFVLLFHYTSGFSDEYMRWHYTGPVISYGYLGLHMFFILSGYCIYLTIQRSHSLADFFAKRLARIWPALIICATITFIVVHVAGLPHRTASWPNYLTNLVLLFPITEHYVDGAYWTLMVELKYYFIFGIFYFLDRKNISSWWFKFCLIGILFSLGSAISAELGLQTVSTSTWIMASKIFLYPYAALFLVGIIIYEWSTISLSERILYFLPVALTLFLSAIQGALIESVLIVGLILISILVIPRTITIPQPLRFIGLVSYPLYLIHQNVGVVTMRELAPLHPYLRIMIAFAIVTGIAAFIHFVLEPQLRKKFYVTIRASLENLFQFAVRLMPKNLLISRSAAQTQPSINRKN